MAKPPSLFSNRYLLPNFRSLRIPNPAWSRNLSVTENHDGGEGFCENPDCGDAESEVTGYRQLSETAKAVSATLKTNPRWENTLLSDFPMVNFADPSFCAKVLKHQNDAHLSLQFYHWLKSQNGFLRNKELCSLIFDGLVKSNAASSAKDFLELTNFMPDVTSLESYLKCLCESRMIEEALCVLEYFKIISHCPLLETWNSALHASILAGRTDVCWQVYGEMTELGMIGDVNTFSCLIEAFCVDGKLSEGFGLLLQLLEAGHIPHVNVLCKLIQMCIEKENYPRMSAILHAMIAKNHLPDIEIYHVIINGLCQRRETFNEAFRVFNDLKDRGYALNKAVYTTMISGLCEMERFQDAHRLGFEMVQKGFSLDEDTYRVLMKALYMSHMPDEADSLLKEMCDMDYAETTRSYNIKIQGLCLCGRVADGYDLFQQMADKNVSRDIGTYSCLIKGLCSIGEIDKAIGLFDELLTVGSHPSMMLYAILIKTLCELRRVEEAKSFWNDMLERGLEPAGYVYEFIIVGLAKQGFGSEGIDWLCTMLRKRLRPSQETLELIIDYLSQENESVHASLIKNFI